MRRILILIIIGTLELIGSLGATATPPATSKDPPEQAIFIDNFAFSPAEVTIAPGTKVTWTNRDDLPHTVTSSDKPRAFGSQAIDTDEKFSHVFIKPGTYAYFCAVHPHMTAKVIVKQP